MTREYAIRLVRERLKNNNLFKHCLAAEACLKELAAEFGEAEEPWRLAGLLHDIDYEETTAQPTKHGMVGAQFLEKFHLDPLIINAIKVHAGHLPPQSKLR